MEHPAPTPFQQGQRGSRGGRSSESLHAEPHSGLQDPAAFLQGDSLFAANPPRQIRSDFLFFFFFFLLLGDQQFPDGVLLGLGKQ